MHSLYEIETVVKRVARYQGLSWGIAEEAGKAVRNFRTIRTAWTRKL
jgi:hypothetical protein